MEIDFMQACQNGDLNTVMKHLSDDIEVIYSVDEHQNNSLHVAVIANQVDIVQYILDVCATHSLRCDIADLKNDQKKTPLELAWELNHRSVAWAIVKSGRSSGSLAKINLLDVVHAQNGDNVLHAFARGNYFDEIKKYLDSCDKPHQFIELCLEKNRTGDLPASLAAKKCHKDSLMILLQPFFANSNGDDLGALLHTENDDGQRIISYVSHYRNKLSVAHGMLIEMESIAHDQNSYAVKDCLRTSLGSTEGAKISVELFQRIRSERTRMETLTGFLRIFSLTFMIRTVFLILDMISDLVLMEKYWNEWGSQHSDHIQKIHYDDNVESSNNPCLAVTIKNVSASGEVLVSHEYGTTNVPLDCYAGAFKGRDRFLLTLVFVAFPFILYYFELLRFRILSSRLDPWRAKIKNKFIFFILFGVVKPLGNVLLWGTWPLVVFFRQFWFTLKLDNSESDAEVKTHKVSAKNAAFISSRAQLIEVCTEASLQPIFQFYLVFQNLLHVDVGQLIQFGDIFDYHKLQLVSVVISLFTLSWSFTVQYRQNKENSVGIFVTLFYFISVAMLVTSRILVFEMFAYSLGAGLFGQSMAFVSSHVLLMSILHFVFSDSAAQCRRQPDQSPAQWARQILLAVHNSLINGLANLYVHNNLEIFIQHQTKVESPPSYGASDVRQRTLIRQVLCDAVILIENAMMLSFVMSKVDSKSDRVEEATILAVVVVALYICGMGMKIFFYCWCHPWAELIRPQSYTQYNGSVVVFSKHIDYHVDIRRCRVRLSQNLESDRKRYKSMKATSSTKSAKFRRPSPAIRIIEPNDQEHVQMNETDHDDSIEITV
ncbi:hypothetical protein TCAL_15011 [Tigriopus californicus]|uniref:XK-related protein n=1 Tax=Tigriopus californicus TaxID=6832 RepID=A0A553NXF7_TIGCA|nr:hypothetical protein TCAL_15011 [Tigriopus californicus]